MTDNSAITQREQATLALLFDEEDDGQSLIGLLAQATDAGSDRQASEDLSDGDLEQLMREHFGITNHIDLAREAASLEAGSGRIDDVRHVEEDFTNEEWEIVRGLQRHCRRIVKYDTSRKVLQKEVRWMFVNTTKDDAGLSFHLACEALQTRPFVVQALVQHYWGLRDIRVGPLPFEADVIPSALYSECLLHAGMEGGDIGRHVWSAPGTPILDAMRRAADDATRRPAGLNGVVSDQQLEQAVMDLKENGLILVTLGVAYFIARRPAFRRFRRLSWSRTFLMDD